MDNQIICPNCGAPNEITSSSCQFCGASLAEVEISQEEESESNVIVEKIKGKPQIKFDNRIFKLEYDEIEDEAKLCLSDSITSTIVGCNYFRYNFTDDCLILDSVKTVISSGKKYNFEYTNTWSCPLIKKDKNTA